MGQNREIDFIEKFEDDLITDDLQVYVLLEQALVDPHFDPSQDDYQFLEAAIVAVCRARGKPLPKVNMNELADYSAGEILELLGVEL